MMCSAVTALVLLVVVVTMFYSIDMMNVKTRVSLLRVSTKGSSSSACIDDDDIIVQQREASNANTTAIVYRTRAPIRYPFLEKIHSYALELQDTESAYDLWVLVDETETTGSAERLRRFFDAMGSRNLSIPGVFSVTEQMILDEYPKLRSYIYNEPEPNVNNEPGECCGVPVMWQMFNTAFTLMMHHNKKYTHAWEIEDDTVVMGKQTMIQLIRNWDLAMSQDGNHVDLAAQSTDFNDVPWNGWIVERHTAGFHSIVEQMKQDESVDAPHWTSLSPTPKWTCLSDSIQRRSKAYSDYLYKQISNNVFAFCECMAQPIAWKGNFTSRELSRLLPENGEHGVVGLFEMLPKRSRTEALDWLMDEKNGFNGATLIFHQEMHEISHDDEEEEGDEHEAESSSSDSGSTDSDSGPDSDAG